MTDVFLGVLLPLLLSHLERELCLLAHFSNLFVDLLVSLLQHRDLLAEFGVLNLQLLRLFAVPRVCFEFGGLFAGAECFQLQLQRVVILLELVDFLK